MGDLKIQVPNGTSSSQVLLKDTLYAPNLCLTVVLIGHILKAGFKLEFMEGSCSIKKGKDGPIIGRIPASANGLFKVEHVFAAVDTPIPDEPVDILTLHQRLGHVSTDTICSLIHTGSITGLHVIDDFPPFICDLCKYAKMTWKPIHKERTAAQAQTFREEVHTDVWGPSPSLSLGRCKYYVTFTDDNSQYTRLQVLWTKDEAFEAYKSFSAWAQTQHGIQIKQLHSNCGSEFTSNQFTVFLRQQGTKCHLTTADTPQHNRVAESLNRQLMEHAHAILHHADLSKTLWAEAVLHVVWLKNHTSTKGLGTVTPYEKLYKEKPNLGNVPEWGQSVWVHNPSRSKLDAQAKQARWVGYNTDSTHAHHMYWPGKNSISVEHNVKFISPTIIINTLPPSYASTIAPAQAPPHPPATPPTFAAPSLTPTSTSSTLPPGAPPSTPVTQVPELEDENEVEQTITPRRIVMPTSPSPGPSQPRRSGRTTHIPGYYEQLAGENQDDAEHLDYVFLAGYDDIIAEAIEDMNSDPKSLAEAQSRLDWPQWKEAMDREMATLEKAGTWRTVQRPRDKNIVGS